MVSSLKAPFKVLFVYSGCHIGKVQKKLTTDKDRTGGYYCWRYVELVLGYT